MGARPRVTLGVTGSIAAYKAAELVRIMVQREWEVWVMMTEAAAKYVGPLTFQALTGHPVAVGKCEAAPSGAYPHLDLSGADVLVIAPCTANVIAKMAHGLADDIVTATALAAAAPPILAPAMNERMWLNAATLDNVALLKRRGIEVLEVEHGELACGGRGLGRLCPIQRIAEAVAQRLAAASKTE